MTAHKTGDTTDDVSHDGGIVTLATGDRFAADTRFAALMRASRSTLLDA